MQNLDVNLYQGVPGDLARERKGGQSLDGLESKGGVIDASKGGRALPGEKSEEPDQAVGVGLERMIERVCKSEANMMEGGKSQRKRSFKEVVLPACLCPMPVHLACLILPASARFISSSGSSSHRMIVPTAARAESPIFCSRRPPPPSSL